jgi:hypothetical protein
MFVDTPPHITIESSTATTVLTSPFRNRIASPTIGLIVDGNNVEIFILVLELAVDIKMPPP